MCRFLADKAHSVVVSVDNHLTADGYVYPVQRDECYAALLWLAHNATSIHGDARRLAVAGDSAGGNMATVVTLMARDKGGPMLLRGIGQEVTLIFFDGK